jgi:hypothetical protein
MSQRLAGLRPRARLALAGILVGYSAVLAQRGPVGTLDPDGFQATGHNRSPRLMRC